MASSFDPSLLSSALIFSAKDMEIAAGANHSLVVPMSMVPTPQVLSSGGAGGAADTDGQFRECARAPTASSASVRACMRTLAAQQ